jgi:hypothetical protein
MKSREDEQHGEVDSGVDAAPSNILESPLR